MIIVIGANPTENHPVAATYFKQAAKRGAELIVMDPRGTALKRHATHMLQFRNGSDVALLNALMNVIVTERLYDTQYIQAHTEGFERLEAHIAPFTPEAMEPVCGIDAGIIRAVARKYAKANAAIIFWGMGVSQHTHGTDNARCLISLALMCGQVGGPGPASIRCAARTTSRVRRRRAHPDDVPGLCAGRNCAKAPDAGIPMGRQARSGSGPDRRRGDGRDSCGVIKGMYIQGEIRRCRTPTWPMLATRSR